MSDNLTLSIFCATYNHEKYIRDTLEGFLMQKTDFPFEIIIHDDASTDNTPLILREYEEKNPDLIHVIYQRENQFSKFRCPTQFTFSIMRKTLKGDYIALCEGDDYWTDADKLRIQIEYMDSHPDCVMTGHDAWELNCRTGDKKRLMLFPKEMDIPAEQLIRGSVYMTTASLVFRRDMMYMDDFFLNVAVGDYPLKLYSLAKGKIHCFDRAMSVYRYLSGEDSWSRKQKSNKNSCLMRWINIFAFLEKYNIYTKGIYFSIIKNFINERLNGLFEEFAGLSKEEFQDLCRVCDKDSEYEGHIYYTEMINIYSQYNDEAYLANKVCEFTKKYKNILIYGAGKYGKLIAKQLRNNDIDFKGFIISDNQKGERIYEGKNVWKLSELPYEKEEMGIVIAVGPKLIEEILEVLHNNAIENYIYPFRIDC